MSEERYNLEVLYRGGGKDAQSYGSDLEAARKAVAAFYEALGPFRPVGLYLCAHQDCVLVVRVVRLPTVTEENTAMVRELEQEMNKGATRLPWWKRLG